MKIIGIVSEYNPFHKGHLHHITESRKAAGGDGAVICVMSGNFVQRGEAAIFNKHARAEAAVKCGADAVFELPLPWALSSAEGFARGAVGLLGSLGVITQLSFGSECADIEKLSAVAQALMLPRVNKLLVEELTTGISYAQARQRALEAEIGELARLIEAPNDILSVEYLKALYDQRLNIRPLAIARSGPGHDQRWKGDLRSASEIRGMLADGRDISAFVPKGANEVYRREEAQGRGPVRAKDLETAILSRLRFLGKGAYAGVPDSTEGLGNRLAAAAWTEPSLDSILSAAKTKRYALSRLRRMTMCVSLGIKEGMARGLPPYARLLAAGEKGREALAEIQRKSLIPVITKPSTVKGLDRESRRIFDLECAAGDLYVLGYKAKSDRRGGADWRTSPVIL